jgi:hypothetical protein
MEEHDLLRETYRISLENNKMLHRMRRNAFWGGIVRTIVYAALLAAPIWFYLSYLAPVVDKMMNTIQQVQGTSASAQTQFGQLQDAWKQIEARFKPASTTQ